MQQATAAAPVPAAPPPTGAHHPPAQQGSGHSWHEALIPLGALDPAAVRPLRTITRAILAGWGIPADLCEDVVLVVSELAGNAMRHTRGPARIALARRASWVTLEVTDTEEAPVRWRDPDPDADEPHGWGMAIVRLLAHSVTCAPNPAGGGKKITVTFRVPVPAAGPG